MAPFAGLPGAEIHWIFDRTENGGLEGGTLLSGVVSAAGPFLALGRDEALARGVVINGLPLMTRDAYGGMWHLEDLDTYYAACVTGGPGAFVIPVRDWSEFPAAVRRKLVLEIAGEPAPLTVRKGGSHHGH